MLLSSGVVLKKESFTNYGDIKSLEKTQSITSMCWQKNDKKTSSVSKFPIFPNYITK